MRTGRIIFAALFVAGLIFGGYVWQHAEAEATARADYLAQPVSEDNAVTIAFSASGFLNRDVRVVAFDFGSEDKVIEDAYVDKILNGDLARQFYRVGFRRVVFASGISRAIVIAPQRLQDGAWE